jgi:ribosomal 50S subunit-recycling heat shock protein
MARKLIAKEIVSGDIVEIVYDKEEEDLNVIVTGKQKTEEEVVSDLLEETETANEDENKNSEE